MVAEGALCAEFVQVDIALEHNLTRGGDFEIDGLAFHEFDWGAAEEAGDEIFLDFRRGGNDGAEGDYRVRSDGDCDFHLAGRAVADGQYGTTRRSRHNVDGRARRLRARRAAGGGRAHMV